MPKERSKNINEKDKSNVLLESFRTFWKFRQFITKNWTMQVLLITLSVITVFLTLATPFMGKLIMDNGIMKKDMNTVSLYSVITGLIMFLSMIMQKFTTYVKGVLGRKIRVKLTRTIFKKIEKHQFDTYKDKLILDHVSKISSDIQSSSNIILNIVPDIISHFVKLIAISIIIFCINKFIFILILLYQAALFIRLTFVAKIIRQVDKEVHEATIRVPQALTQTFSQIYQVKTSGAMPAMMNKCLRTIFQSMRTEVKSAKFAFLSGMLTDVLDKLLYWMIVFFGVFFVLKGKMTLGGTGAIMMYVNQGASAATAFVALCSRIVSDSLSLERLTEFLDAKPTIVEKPDAKKVTFSGGKIEFAGVSYAYVENRPVFSKINFVFPAAAKIALVGPSGCGKTTLVNLVLRLYDVAEGAVLIEDHDVRDMTFRSIHSQCCIAPQTLYFWPETIKQNIVYGRRNISDEQIASAAEIADCRSFIDGLTDKYDTKFGEMITPLSQGQKQRIAIARAVLTRPKILILDEACSSLDSQTEDRIVENIRKAFADSSVIMITHRLSAARKMDQIYYLKDASSMVCGTHEQLTALEPKYVQLFSSQIGAPVLPRVQTA